MAQVQYSYIGKGSIYIDGLPIGNVSALRFAAEEEKKTLKDYENAGGGTVDTVSRISGVTMEMTVTNLSPENIALAMRGASTPTAGGTVTDEPHNDIRLGRLILLNRIADPAIALVVKKGATTLAENTDYTRTRAGIIPLDSVTLAEGDDLTVSYTALADNVVQALTSAGQEFDMVFDGLNEAKSGASVVVNAFKVKFNPAQALDLIGDEFAELQMTADVVKDTSKTGAGISQYFTVRATQVLS